MSATQARNMILGQIMTNRVTDQHILSAIERTRREPFLPENLRGAAYVDEDLEIAPGRTMMAPMTFARLLDLAQITPDSRVLVVGCLSGYPVATLAQLAGHIVGIETDAALLDQARGHMTRLGIQNVNLQQVRTLADGYALSAPYDVIVVFGGVQMIPEGLGSQLALSGHLVTVRVGAKRVDSPLGQGCGLVVCRLDQKLQYREHFDAASAVLPGFEKSSGFTF